MKYVKPPRMVDEMMQIGPFEVDEAALIVVGIVVGILTDMMIWGLFAGVILSGVFAKYKQGKNRGFLLHYMYWLGFLPAKGSPFDIVDKRYWIK